MNSSDKPKGKPCHHFRLIFTDGACRLNGQVGATAGIGLALGGRTSSQQAIPITTSLDPNQKRTSQRAELLAALAGLRYLVECAELNGDDGLGFSHQLERKRKKTVRNEALGKSEFEWVKERERVE